MCSRGGGGLLRERMRLLRALWDAGLSAEMMPAAAPSLTDAYEYATARGLPWMVIISTATFSGGCRLGGRWSSGWVPTVVEGVPSGWVPEVRVT